MKKILTSCKFIAGFMKKYLLSVVFVLFFIIVTTWLNVHSPKFISLIKLHILLPNRSNAKSCCVKFTNMDL